MADVNALLKLELPIVRRNYTWSPRQVQVEFILIGLIVVVGGFLHLLSHHIKARWRISFPMARRTDLVWQLEKCALVGDRGRHQTGGPSTFGKLINGYHQMTSSVNQQRGLDANLGHPENSIANVNDGLYEQQPILAGEKWDIWSSWLQLDDRGLDDHRVSHDPDRQTQPLGRRDRIPRSKTVLLILGLQLRHDTKLRKEPLGEDLDDVHCRTQCSRKPCRWSDSSFHPAPLESSSSRNGPVDPSLHPGSSPRPRSCPPSGPAVSWKSSWKSANSRCQGLWTCPSAGRRLNRAHWRAWSCNAGRLHTPPTQHRYRWSGSGSSPRWSAWRCARLPGSHPTPAPSSSPPAPSRTARASPSLLLTSASKRWCGVWSAWPPPPQRLGERLKKVSSKA